jgi:hypothetical protein
MARNIGVLDRFANELDHRIEGLERMMQKDIPLPDHRQNVRLVDQAVGRCLQERRIRVLVEIGLVDERGHSRQIDRAVASVEIEFLQIELTQQQLRQVLRASGGDFQPHREAKLALRQLAFQSLPQILDFLLV